MSEPTTVNKALVIPNTGDLAGTWGSAAINPDMTAIDGMLGGFATISLSSATTFALSLPVGAVTSITPGAGPNQSQNALLKFTGTLTGNAVVQFTMPGFYIVHNNCTVGTSYIQLVPATGTGNAIGAPPGQKVHVFFDGTDMDYVNMPAVGSALDLHGATTMPPWMLACTFKPYLVKDGNAYLISQYPQLAAALGTAFGANATFFAVPDERARARIAIDTISPLTGTTSFRLNTLVSGISGTTMGSAGGTEFLQAHLHGNILQDPGHGHPGSSAPLQSDLGGAGSGTATRAGAGIALNINPSLTGLVIGNATAGLGASQNVQPSIVSFLPLVKT